MRSTFETTFSRNFFAGAAPTIPADTVRLARLADLHHVLDLVERSSLAPGCGADEPRLVRAAPDTGIDSVGTAVRNGTCYVAESDGRVIGVCAWVDRNGAAGAEGPRSRTSDTTARVVALAVDATHPPLALARLLVTLCQSAVAPQGCDSLEAVASRPQRWLYLACGFRAVGPAELRCPGGDSVCGLRVRKSVPGVSPTPAAEIPSRQPDPSAYRSFTAAL